MRIDDIITEKIKLSEDASGIDFDLQIDQDTGSFATVTARAHGRILGSVEFFVDGDTLVADQLEVDERYRGQGIAAAMYDYAKSQGYTIQKSPDLTPDGEHFWNKNQGDKTVWEADQINELGNAPAEYTANRKRKNSLFHATVDNQWVDVFFDRSEFNDTLHITFTVNGNYDTPSRPTSASKSTVKILSTVLNVIKQRLPEYIKKSRPPGISFTAKEDNRAGLYRKYFVPVIQDILGHKWTHEEYSSMGMTVFHWKPVAKSKPVTEDQDYMAGHCHVMAIALKMLHPDWQIRAHVGWEDDAAEDDEYRVDHVYIVASDGSAYDCRGQFPDEESLVGEDVTGGFETQYADFDLADIEQLVRRGELKRFTRQDIDHAMRFAKQIDQQGVAENFADGRNPGRKGLAKRSGVNTKASVTSLRKTAKNSSGEKARMAHWLANMKAGRAKARKK